jgi:hypothetical protein
VRIMDEGNKVAQRETSEVLETSDEDHGVHPEAN